MQRSPRIAHVISNLNIGGAEIALLRLIRAGKVAGRLTHAVWSLRDVGDVGRQIAELVPVHSARLGADAGAFGRWRTLVGEIEGFEPDIVQGWMYHGNIAASFVHRALGSRPQLMWNIRGSLRATDHEKRSTRAVISISRWFSRRPRVLVNNSRVSAEDHVRFGYPAGVWKLIPNGFDTTELRPCAPAEVGELRAAMGIGEGRLVVGALGRNHPIKGHRHFIDAVFELSRRGLPVTGVLAGPGWEPDSEAARAVLARGADIRFLGPVTEVGKALGALDILCLSSMSEGFPNVVGEAMSCGVPCVVSDVGDAAEIVRGIGEIVQPGDAHSLADAISRIWTKDPRERAVTAEAGRQRIVDRYSLSSVAASYETLYMEALEGRFRADM
jgi:glycosyltransferase involved in cell wall biosynthesis